MNWDLISAICFYSLAGILLYLNRKKIEVIGGLIFAFKTKKAIEWMQVLAKYKSFWKVFSIISIPISIYFMISISYRLLVHLGGVFAGEARPGVTLLIPGVAIPGAPFFVPFWPGIISIIVLAFVHEFSHGIIAACEGIRIKSCGFGFLLFFPIAFVELDDEDVERKSVLTRLRVASVGSFSNFLVAFGISLLLASLVMPTFETLIEFKGINITRIEEGFPAERAGITPGTIIYELNGIRVETLDEFAELMLSFKPGQEINLETSKGNFSLVLAANPKNESRAYIGVEHYLDQLWDFKREARQRYGIGLDLLLNLWRILFWVYMLNFLVGVMNLFPLWITDGGKIVQWYFEYFIKSKDLLIKIASLIFSLCLTILILNLIGPYIF
jgi:hypothetical protein